MLLNMTTTGTVWARNASDARSYIRDMYPTGRLRRLVAARYGQRPVKPRTDEAGTWYCYRYVIRL